MKKVVITGAHGQDGQIMSKMLEEYFPGEYKIYKVVRKKKKETDIELDISDSKAAEKIFDLVKPNLFFNFAALSIPSEANKDSDLAARINYSFVSDVLSQINKRCCGCKFLNAGSIEEFGSNTPYAESKRRAHLEVEYYRDMCGIWAVQPYLCSHVSPQSNPTFIFPKLASAADSIAQSIFQGKEFAPVYLGNLNSERYFASAYDIIECCFDLINEDSPVDYVFAPETKISIRDLTRKFFIHAGIKCEWRGHGTSEELCITKEFAEISESKSSILCKVSKDLFRPIDNQYEIPYKLRPSKKYCWFPADDIDSMIVDQLSSLVV